MDKPIIIDLFRHADDRGILDQIFDFEKIVFPRIKRIYATITKKGIIRGMHGHFKEWKAFYVSKGEAKFVIVPMSQNSDFIRATFTLNEMKPQILVLPPNYYHGYVSLGDELRLLILSDATLDESKSDDHRLNPKEFQNFFEVVSR